MALTVPVAEIVERSTNPLLGKAESWGRVLLGDIATIQNGFAFKSSQFVKDAGMPLIRIRDVGKDTTDTRYNGEYDPAYVVNAGDLLIGMDGDFNCARWSGEPGLLNQRVCRISLTSDIYHPKLLDYALPGYLKAINEMTSSVTVKHLSSKSIAEIPLPLPPMEQQERIVAEIEKQFSRLDEAVANLKRVKANLKRYKAAVLKAAVEGKLTEEWRKAHPDVEPASKLLDRILAERRAKWEEAELAKMEVKGKTPKNDKWKAKYKEPVAPDTTNLPDLPGGWVWAKWEQVGLSQNGRPFPSKDYCNEGVKLLRPGNLHQSGVVVWTPENTRHMPYQYEERNPDLIIEDGELVMNLTAQSLKDEFLGRVCLTAPGERCLLNQRLARLTPIVVLPEFALVVFKSNLFRRFVDGLNTGSLIQHMFTSQIATFAFPVPPLIEQHRIVAEVNRHLSLLSDTEAQVDASVLRAQGLRRSILEQAFCAGYRL